MTGAPVADSGPVLPPETQEGAPGGGKPCCSVELFGLARSIVGRRVVAVELPAEARVADALARLAADCPELVGRVVRADGGGLTEGHVLNLNGRAFVEDVCAEVRPGDTLLILSNTAGG